MTSELESTLQAVEDERTFLAFLRALTDDWVKSGRSSPERNHWENVTIGDFLESAAAYTQDTPGASLRPPLSTNPWRRFADILRAGAFYE